jgi:hypothetical protein
LRLFLKIVGCLTVLVFGAMAEAQSTIQLELVDRGFVDAKISAEVNGSTFSHTSAILLPFGLNPSAEIRTADNIDVSVLSAGNDYTLLSALYPPNITMIEIRLLDAIELHAAGSSPRVKLELDFSYASFQQHSSLRQNTNLNLVDSFDLEVLLPQSIAIDDISLNPRAGWVVSLPQVGLSSAANSGKTVFVAFSNTYRDTLWVAQIIIGAFASSLLLLVAGKPLINRTVGTPTLVTTAIVTTLGLSLVLFFFNILSEPLGFLAWVIGLAFPWPIMLLVCVFFLWRKYTDAEITGSVQISNPQGIIPAEFVEITLLDADDPEWSMNATVKNQGTYRCFVYCLVKQRKITVTIDDQGFDAASSKQMSISRSDRLQVDPIVLQRKLNNP